METRDWRLEIGDRSDRQSAVPGLQSSFLWRVSLVAILLVAFFLRVHLLPEVPPGLTHDEANHGREAMGILEGNLALFFPLNYGSEPLYSYTAAAVMGLVGRGLLALRLVTVYAGVLAISATYLFGRLALGRSAGWLGAALMAVSFWPLASSREALRAGLMPLFTAGALIFFWLLIERARSWHQQSAQARLPRWLLVMGLTLCLTAALYDYLAARVLWLVFPLFLLYLLVARRSLLQQVWPAAVASLGLSAALVAPMFAYLQQHPEAQTRLQMFGVAGDLLQGNVVPLLQNAGGALLAFGWPGAGDQFLAYNLPGRPVLTPLSAIFFVLGVAICLWRWRRPAYALLLIWFAVGVTPSLLTGATANTTRNVGAMPATFLLPTVGFVTLARTIRDRVRSPAGQRALRWILPAVAALWLTFVTWSTARDYFVRWAQAPEVRAAYMQTLVQQLAYVEDHAGATPAIISSQLPSPAHDQSIGLVLLPGARELRWVDARWALILPPEGAMAVIPASTPLDPTFASWLDPVETIPLRDDDLDPSFTAFALQVAPDLPHDAQPVTFGAGDPAVTLTGSRWLTPQVRPGETATLLQVWQVEDETGVGPSIAAIGGSDVVLFTHLLDDAGNILAQADRLDAPSTSWKTGDTVVQIHRLTVPQRATPGVYIAVAGVYDRRSQEPLPIISHAGRWDATRAKVDSLNIIP